MGYEPKKRHFRMPQRHYNPCSRLPRRLQIVASLLLAAFVGLYLLGRSDRSSSKYKKDHAGRPFAESVLNPFRVPAHTPPAEQENSTHGDVSWFSHLKWSSPWSDAISLDGRAVLPFEERRTPIYTFYDYGLDRNKVEKEAESELIMTWRRAWWAKGFRPIVLGKPDALKNPLYKKVQALEDIPAALRDDLQRWLAWGNMGTGILSNYLVLPMCEHHNPLMVTLRKGKYSKLTQFKGLENSFFLGDKKSINDAIQSVVDIEGVYRGDSVAEVVPKGSFTTIADSTAIAFYWIDALKAKYTSIYDMLTTDPSEARRQLRRLMEAHLQLTWQNIFTEGIAVLRPLPESMTAAVTPADDLAGNITTCLNSPFPSSCPPNKPDCKPCMPTHPMPVETFAVYRNDSRLFTIGTVPHPFTTHSLMKKQRIKSAAFVRRETNRDPYILAATAEALGTGRSSFARITYMKKAIASSVGYAGGIWMTAERSHDESWMEDISWRLGFPLPSEKVNDGKSNTPVPGPERAAKLKEEREGRTVKKKRKKFVPEGMPDEKGVEQEGLLVQETKTVLKRREQKANRRLMGVIEAWNLADTELWNFVRAFNAQRRVERMIWEDTESRFAGGEGGKMGVRDRWFRTQEEF